MGSIGDATVKMASPDDITPILLVADESRVPTSSKTSPLNLKFANLVENTLKKWHIEGVAIAVVDGDETWSEGYGKASLPDTPVQPSTLFYTGSTTKSFTAAAASLLVDDNRYPNLRWTTPLNQLIREDFVLEDEYATSHVTLEDALSHRTGLPGHTLSLAKPGTVRDAVRNLRHLHMNKEIRTTWQYCNAMFVAVSHVIEVVTGEWLGEFLRKRLWIPLGMNSTFLSHEDAHKYAVSCGTTVAKPYAWDESTSTSIEVPYLDGPVSGAGLAISTVLDYAKYLRSMIRKSGPLSTAGYDSLLQPRSFMPGIFPQFKKPIFYTLGWMSTVYRGETIILHPGGMDGFTSTMIYLPEKDWGVVVFCNAAGPGREVLAWHLIDDLLEVPVSERVDLFDITQKSLAAARELHSTAQERLYPCAPSPGLPLALQLAEYAGTYTHLSYPELTVGPMSDDKPQLHVIVGGSLTAKMILKHVSGEFFLAELFLYVSAVEPTAIVKAEFQVDAKGKVGRFGVCLDFQDMPETLIWFDRLH